jgi:hypothetical protein
MVVGRIADVADVGTEAIVGAVTTMEMSARQYFRSSTHMTS